MRMGIVSERRHRQRVQRIRRRLLIVAMVALATQITRWTPFLLFSGERKLPRVGEDLGKLLPPAMMGLLVVYCLKNVTWTAAPHGIPELLAILAVVLLHRWRGNVLLSIAGGTALYMALVQLVFA